MAKLLTHLGLLGLLAFLSFSFDGIPLGPAGVRRRAAAAAAGMEAADEAAAEKEPSSGQPDAHPEPTDRGRWRRRGRSALSWLLYLTLVVGAVAGVPRALSWALDTPQPLAAVSGTSMWPTLNRGDLVVLQGVDGVEDLQVGDIIAFRQQRGLSIHRVVRINGETITTRGDGNFVSDSPITIDDVIGKVPTLYGRLARIPFLGHLSLVLGLGQDRGFRPAEEQPLSQPVRDLAEEDAGRILGPVDDLSKEELADESERLRSASGQGTPVADLREERQAPDSPAVVGSPIAELSSKEQ